MRKILFAGLIPILFGLLSAACGSEEYAVVTEDYSVHFAKTRPEVDANSGTASFVDTDGQHIVVPRSAIKQVRPIR